MLPKWSCDQETMWCQRPRWRTGLEDQRWINLPISFCTFVRQAYVPVSTGWRMSEGNKMVQFLLRRNSNKTHLTQTPSIQPQHTICCHRALEYYTWTHNHRFTVTPHQALQPCHWPQTQTHWHLGTANFIWLTVSVSMSPTVVSRQTFTLHDCDITHNEDSDRARAPCAPVTTVTPAIVSDEFWANHSIGV